jgi:AbrB family looped-hinge helix DNA binding protein
VQYEMVKMSPKGQLVVPQEIRAQEGLNPGDRFVPFLVEEGILFKKVNLPVVQEPIMHKK